MKNTRASVTIATDRMGLPSGWCRILNNAPMMTMDAPQL
ncbi:hypothetical protein T230_04775 [Tannerella sp. oral taxon BU063 isolate Cell 1/3]|uniref:Uncharacterized protein n=1 Tax=Tannerella sp. oral taxon BU063 isolate Cell 1/3 TaxID=1411022 RepID=W2CSQ2_9BACT|nr:hypothetical protein T230_04775 [Tannerella sp. oral taxon BU063 isolate Cell 1/3]